VSTLPNPLAGVNSSNPLGWPGMTGTNMPPTNTSTGAPSVPGMPTVGGAPAPAPSAGGAATPTPSSTNPFGGLTTPTPSPVGGGALAGNLAQSNLTTAGYRNQLIPIFAQLFGGATGPAMNFFQQLMNLGSPYYQQQQQASFGQGVNQAQNAAAQSKQQLNATGYGYTPSGQTAAMLGGEATGESQNLSQLYLQNLFQNEQMQAIGAQGLASLASLFNPAGLMGQTSTSIQQPENTAAEMMSAVGQLAGGIFGTSGIPTGGGGGGGGGGSSNG
jgi:hypothetical protein